LPDQVVNPEAYNEALRIAFSASRSVADRYRTKLMKDPNVIDVQAGYKFKDGWLTDTPSVVVTVLRKDPPEAVGDRMIPPELDGIPTDVAPATPAEQLRFLTQKKGGARAGTRGATRGVTPLPPQAQEEPLLAPGDVPGLVDESTRGVGEGHREYKEPKDLKLAPVSGAMTLLCHASPDAGWPNLKKFLGDTGKTLTVAMYDFGAPYIFETIKGAMEKAKGPFILNLDRKSNPKRDGELTEEDLVEKYSADLGKKFEYSTAAVGVLYPNAYHIKVAVRDSSSFWLSSGNWQGSNQPEADASKIDEAQQRQLLSKRNREWHVISDNKKLAQTFEAYIKYDVEGAKAAAAEERGVIPPPTPELILPAEEELRAAMKAVKIFPAKKFALTAADKVKVQPILTPDNYGENVVKLIQSAKKTLYFQNQYIKIPKVFPDNGGKPALKELVDAMLDRIKAGVDVRIILRNEGDTRAMLQGLKVYGFDMSRVKMLGGCHNKGIVVDSSVVMVSSQNYSADGVRYNRDAGLIISSPKVAKYFEQIFLYDWDVRATQRVDGERGAMPLLPEVAAAAPGGGTRSAGQRLSWDEYYQD
jgi:hypothetical protein